MDEPSFMTFFPGEFFQATVRTLLSSFLPAKAVVTSPENSTTYAEQLHVLRTKPIRVLMPTERAAAATAVSVRTIKKKNHVGQWLDKNHHIEADPIHVSTCGEILRSHDRVFMR